MEKIKCFFVEDTGRDTGWQNTFDADDKPSGKMKSRIFRRTDTGEEITNLYSLPAGAMWFADWYDDMFAPQLAHVLVVKTPGGDWIVDSQSANCTMPDDRCQKKHHCWIIEGNNLPEITVNKNGPTCAAGAGSIMCGSYHGFLRGGYLESC